MITLNCHRGIMYTWALAAKRLHFFLLERGEENVRLPWILKGEEGKWLTDQLSRTWRVKTVQLLLGQIRSDVGFEHRPLDRKAALMCS